MTVHPGGSIVSPSGVEISLSVLSLWYGGYELINHGVIDGGSRLHVQYITQIGIRPPTFVVFTAGGKAGLHFSFVRHLENRMREEFGFLATPIRFVERHKSKRRR